MTPEEMLRKEMVRLYLVYTHKAEVDKRLISKNNGQIVCVKKRLADLEASNVKLEDHIRRYQHAADLLRQQFDIQEGEQ